MPNIMVLSKISFVDCASLRADIVLLLESSTSVNHANFLQFMELLVENYNIDSGDVQVAVVNLRERPFIEIFFGDYKNKEGTKQAIRKVPFRRRLADFPSALKLVRETLFGNGYGSRFDAPNIVVLLTDGFNTTRRNIEQIKEQLKLNAQANIKTYCFGNWYQRPVRFKASCKFNCFIMFCSKTF
ncbi:hypothetical protein KUTeg_001571 [Tegillarca granosa]|uniref:VWFA domain-containing protein n=1 Tax=Tegillarca granosa TaxID=220873 RepID=A0ABQ9FRU1_TEGGR|nr:hypothetical protein KUTeg_001571 [Tegillarca granosa]